MATTVTTPTVLSLVCTLGKVSFYNGFTMRHGFRLSEQFSIGHIRYNRT